MTLRVRQQKVTFNGFLHYAAKAGSQHAHSVMLFIKHRRDLKKDIERHVRVGMRTGKIATDYGERVLGYIEDLWDRYIVEVGGRRRNRKEEQK